MTDFSQILLREIDAKKESGKTTKKKEKKKPLRKKNKESKKNKTPKSLPVEKNKKDESTILSKEVENPVWLSMFEAAKIGGVEKKTIKRAIKSDLIKYKIIDNRYQVELRSVILFLISRKKLLNKLKENGIGQYIEKWIE